MKKILILCIILLVLPGIYAATCGNNDATGNEECDGQDLRGYDCYSLCYLNRNNPQEYDPTDGQWDGMNHYDCYDGGTLSCKNNCDFSVTNCYDIRCGDGQVQGAEECDDGSGNSDSTPNACRSDCEIAHCGDGVEDSGEQCDDGTQNSDEIPGACRRDCTLPTCGDGVIDPSVGEECDDDFGDCFKCMRCQQPYDNMVITQDTVLCDGHFSIDDQGAEGVIRVTGNGITVKCGKTYLYGIPQQMEQFQNANNIPQGINANTINQPQSNTQQQQQTSVQEQSSGGFFSGIVQFITNIFTEEEPEPTNPLPSGGAISEIKRGTGILISGNENTLIGCDVRNYRFGIKTTGERNVISNNKACQNNNDFFTENNSSIGLNNDCNTGNWFDIGYERCTFDCEHNERTQTQTQCPPCEECEECTTEEPPEEPPEPEEVICPDGTTAETLQDCPPELIKCPDGRMVESLVDCVVVGCPEDTVECKDKTCVKEKWQCDPYKCDDGTLVEDKEDCPQKCRYYECNNGECVKEEWMCDPYVCKGGEEVEDKENCPEYCAYECEDGTCVGNEDDCPKEDECPYTCEDGSCVKSEDDCPQTQTCPGEYECADGSCVKSADLCLVCCKTIGGLAAPVINYEETTASACVAMYGAPVEISFCQ